MSTSNSKADSDKYIHVKFNIFGFSCCGLLLQKQIGPTFKQYSENTSPVCFNKICLIALQMSKGAILPDLGYDSFSDVGEIRVYRRADFQSGSRVLKKVF